MVSRHSEEYVFRALEFGTNRDSSKGERMKPGKKKGLKYNHRIYKKSQSRVKRPKEDKI